MSAVKHMMFFFLQHDPFEEYTKVATLNHPY